MGRESVTVVPLQAQCWYKLPLVTNLSAVSMRRIDGSMRGDDRETTRDLRTGAGRSERVYDT